MADRERVELAARAEVARVAEALRTAIRLSEVSNREIERRLFMSTGYLTRVLKGEVDLKVRHVLGVLDVIGFPEGSFFGALFPVEPPESLEEARMARGLSSLVAIPEEPRDPQEVLAELRECARHLFEVLERGQKK